jgi:hypothetical protein
MRRSILLATASVAAVGCGASRAEIKPPYAHFLEQSYVMWPPPKRPERLKYEAQTAPNIVVAQTVETAAGLLRNDMQHTDGVSKWYGAQMAFITPNFIIRQLEDSSAAVRTPTFNPKGTYQWIGYRKAVRQIPDPNDSTKLIWEPDNVNSWKHVDLRMLDVQFAHYSNGQAGCFYERQLFVKVGDEYVCRWLGNDSTNRTINNSDGSFSTWYLRGGLGFERMWGIDSLEAQVVRHAGVFLTAQWHIPAMTEEPQKPLYGDARIRGTLELEQFCKKCWRMNWQALYYWDTAVGAASGIPASHWVAETSLSWEPLFGLGVFLRRHEGQDYYNIAFTKTLNVWQGGLMFKLDRRDAFAP